MIVAMMMEDNVRGDSRGDDGRLGSRSQEIINYYFHNYVESVDGDGRSWYGSHTSPSPSQYSCGIVKLFGFSV